MVNKRFVSIFSVVLPAIMIMVLLNFEARSEEHFFNLPAGQKPLEVEVFFYLNDISDINEQDETFAINGTLELSWIDTRLAFDSLDNGAGYKLYQGPFQFLEVYQGWWPQLIAANGIGNIPLQDVSLKIHTNGKVKMVQEISAVLKSPMNLRKYPFDRQKLQMILEPLSFIASEVLLVSGPQMMDMPRHHLKIAGWELLGLNAESRIEQDQQGSHEYSQIVISLDMVRKPGYTTWLVFIPLTFIIILSSSIYWMDAESLGNRMDISFIGLLTIVAYQAMVEAGLPKIDYFTLINGFVYISYFIMASFIISNILIDQLNRKRKTVLADKIDQHARWMMPLAYISLNLLSGFYFYFST
jgi:hypothetical protein